MRSTKYGYQNIVDYIAAIGIDYITVNHTILRLCLQFFPMLGAEYFIAYGKRVAARDAYYRYSAHTCGSRYGTYRILSDHIGIV
jgi:hypothetical protein